MRWQWFWQNRIFKDGVNDGSFSYPNKAISQYIQHPICPVGTNPALSNWSNTNLGPNSQPSLTQFQNMGPINCLWVDPANHNFILAGTPCGGMFKTTNGGQTWINPDISHLPGIGINSIVVVPNTNNLIIYIATGIDEMDQTGYGNGVLKSIDGGATWHQTSLNSYAGNNVTSPNNDDIVYKLLLDPNDPTYNTIYAITRDIVYKTTNGFTTSPTVLPVTTPPGIDFSDIQFKPGNSSTLVLASYQDVYFSNNAGASWTIITPNTLATHISISCTNNDIYCLYHSSFDFLSYIVKSSYATPTNWTNVGTPQNWFLTLHNFKTQLIVNKLNPQVMYIGMLTNQQAGDVMKSTHGGIYWDAILYPQNPSGGHFHDQVRDIKMIQEDLNGEDYLMIATNGGISQTLDGGNSNGNDWININGTGLSNDEIYAFDGIQEDADRLICATKGNFELEHIGNNWSFYNAQWGTETDCYNIVMKDDDYSLFGSALIPAFDNISGFYTYLPSFWRRIGGVWPNCSAINDPANGTEPFNILRPIVYQDKILYVGDQNIYKSYDFGSSWTPLSPYPYSIDDKGLRALAVAESDPNIIYAVLEGPHNLFSNNKFFFSNDGGTNWFCLDANIMSALQHYGITSIAVDPYNPYRVWIGLGGFCENGNGTGIGQNRVWYGYSTNNGSTWTWADYSSGLPQFPVISLVYQKGTYDGLYVGTDVGVFFRDAVSPGYTNNWVCFNENLPVSIITDLEINYCTQKIRASTFGRGMWESPLANTPEKILDITSNTLWDVGTTNIEPSDIIIHPPATLTIKGKVLMNPQKKIQVMQGASLVVDGGTITCACDMWQGIEVWGNTNQAQFPTSNQGYVNIIHGGTIEYAWEGITNWHPGVPTSFSQIGGIIYATDAHFINNKRSVSYYLYHNIFPSTYRSSFVNCTFDVDNNFRGNSFNTHVSMWGVNGISFRGCTFTNNQTNKTFHLTDNSGINSIDAGYSIYTYLSSPGTEIKSSFTGFNHGVQASSSASPYVVRIDKSVFDQNVFGVYYNGINNSWINRSEFKIGNNTISGCPYYQKGIFTYYVPSFRIEENILGPSSLPVPNNYGIHIYETGGINNQVYKNSFSYLQYGSFAEGINWNLALDGLRFLCNSNNYNAKSDIVTAQTSTNSSIATNQMDITSSHSVDNTFSYLPTNYYNIYNGCNNNIRYTTRHNLPSLHYDPGAANVYNVLLEYNDKPNGCPSNFGNNPNPGPVPMPILPTGGINEVLSNMGAKGTAYLSLLYNYYNLIDGGNTEMLLNTIELSWPENAWDLRAVLLSKSPYLSKDVLVETAMKGTLPQAMLLEVILANPDACRSEDVLEILGENIPNPFPEYLIEVVRANKDNKTLRTAMEEIISSVSKEFSDLNKLLIDYSLMDSTYNVAEARIYMLKRGGLYDYYAVAESYIDEGNMDSVWYYFYKIPEVFKMNETDIAEWDNYKDYYSCRGRLIDRNLNLMQLGSDEELTVLQTIADLETGRASALAQNILCFFYEKCKDDPSEENGENRLLSSKPLSGVKKTNMNIVKATPNPANVYVDFSWQLPILNGDAILTIADGTGKLIEQRNINNNYGHWIWDTRNVNSGVYYYDIKADKTSFGSDKLIIRK